MTGLSKTDGLRAILTTVVPAFQFECAYIYLIIFYSSNYYYYFNVNLDYFRLIDIVQYFIYRLGISLDMCSQTNTQFLVHSLLTEEETVTCSRNRNMIIDLSNSKPGNC